MKASPLLLCALVALLTPAGCGLLVAPFVASCGAGARAVLGVALLAAAPCVTACSGASAAAAVDGEARTGWRVRGRWRTPPARPAQLATPRGALPVVLAGDLLPPAPGSLVQALVRGRPDGSGQVVSLALLDAPRGAWLDRWAAACERRLRVLRDAEQRGLVAGLLLGRRGEVPHAFAMHCASTGIQHILAVSGLHVGLIVAVFSALLGAGGRALLGPLLAGFILLAGSRPPLLRAGLGWVAARVATATARATGGLHRLAGVALLMGALWPGVFTGLSAQLSFLAVAGLIAAARLGRGPLGAVLASAGAFLATAPSCAETFGVVAPIGILVTPLVVPLVGLVLGLAALVVLPCTLLSAADPLLVPALGLATDLLRAVLALAAAAAPEPWRPTPPPVPGWLIGLAVVGALVLLGRSRHAAGGSRLAREAA